VGKLTVNDQEKPSLCLIFPPLAITIEISARLDFASRLAPTQGTSQFRQECTIMFRNIVVLVGGLASLSAVPLFAQEAVLGQEYGAGVHAFFAGDYAGAYEQLTTAIQAGSKDPRAFYFRGLACLNLGRDPDAIIDFRKGAELESSDVNRFYDVGRALERVQGSARTELEKYRVAARMAALEAAEKVRKDRYQAIQREESRVLRQQAQNAPPSGEEIVPPPAADDEDEDPFAVPGEASKPGKKSHKAGKATKKPAKAAPGDDSDEDPFATGPAPEKKPAKKATPEKPADKGQKSTEKKQPGGEDDPFAEPNSPQKPGDKAKKPDDGKKPAPPADKKPPSDEKKPDPGKKPADKKPDPTDPFAP
jgi:hypothetical protein